ncbi:hypothetical protein [Nonomuraea typhae]|uniref:hypothetical protein n=1 Tax=Nonomuraea typhae TaxID=2603600 RepID=UPI0012F8ADAA|nr:hypothetical protein [Nonomuraea typhae]
MTTTRGELLAGTLALATLAACTRSAAGGCASWGCRTGRWSARTRSPERTSKAVSPSGAVVAVGPPAGLLSVRHAA